jgi:hypothetical protein
MVVWVSIQVGGRLVFVDYETGKPKGSFRTPDGQAWSKQKSKGDKATKSSTAS